MDGPSGFADPPRPFVLRAAHLDGLSLKADETFHIDLHLFRVADPGLSYFVLAFIQIAKQGIGPGRGRAELIDVIALNADRHEGEGLIDRSQFLLKPLSKPIQIFLSPVNLGTNRIRVNFLTPTELKVAGYIISTTPSFASLFARVRDRVGVLRSLYGLGPLELDFCGMAKRAQKVQIVRTCIQNEHIWRKSSRTGATHGIGGFIGNVEYDGQLDEFIPFFRAAYWTGIGRHTAFGCGSLCLELIPLS